MEKKIQEYIKKWRRQGYPTGIPDVVPSELMSDNLAPSYKAICIAILKNDHSLKSLGFVEKKSIWYNVLKRIEISKREKHKLKTISGNDDLQLYLFY
jgi:predicted phosphoadenosine phosphosulfate sulfurtransferase